MMSKSVLRMTERLIVAEHFPVVVGFDVTTLKMVRKPVKLQRKIQQDALGKVNRVKEIRR